MLQVSWQQWSEVFERLGWASPLPEELWHRMGGGTEQQVDWQEVYRLIKSTGWSDQHAQTLWLTLNNFAEPTPEPVVTDPQEDVPEVIAPAPWDAPAVKPEPAGAAAPIKEKKARSISLPAIKLPAFVAQIDKRVLLGLGAAVVLVVGYLVFFSGGSNDGSSENKSANPAPAAGLILNQNFLTTYFSWKKDLPAKLCLMTKNCKSSTLDKRLTSISTTSANFKFMEAASLYKLVAAAALKSPQKIVFKPSAAGTIFRVPVVVGGKPPVWVCGTLLVESGQVKILADSDYKPANFMVGTALKPCGAK